MDTVETTLKNLLSSMGFTNTSIEQSEIAGQTIFSIKVAGDTRDLIGTHGDTLHAIDTIVKKIMEKKAPRRAHREETESGSSEREPMFLIDIDEYRTRQIRDIQTKAKMMAERARSFEYDVELSPMSAYERLIVHTALQNEPNVKTESQGEGRGRRVVIKYSAS